MQSMMRQTMSIWFATGMLTILANVAVAASDYSTPNFSFESPTTTFVATVVDSWQQAPSPDTTNPATF